MCKNLIQLARQALKLYDHQTKQNKELEDKILILKSQLHTTQKQLQASKETNKQLLKLLDTNKYRK